MAERARHRFAWALWSRFERLTFVSCVLVWIGTSLFGVGLYIAFRNQRLDQEAHAEGTAIAAAATETATPTATVPLYAVGWVTATPTPTATATTTPMPSEGTSGRPYLTPTPRSTRALQPTPDEGPPAATQPPDRLVIPAIELDTTILPVGSYTVEEKGQRYKVWQVADYAVGWHDTSAYPGQAGNIVLNGHHNIKGQVFRYLVDLEVGARVLVYVGDQAYHYAVSEKLILPEKDETAEVRRKNATWIAPTEDERLTMVTCWPYTDNTHRLVIVARPTSPMPVGLEE